MLIAEATYPWSVGLVRMSILLFFLQTFPGKNFQLVSKIFLYYMVPHTLLFFFLIVFQCQPIPYAWDKSIDGGKCINVTALTYAGAVLAAIHDFGTLIIPINELRKLNMNAVQKAAVILMFTIGGL